MFLILSKIKTKHTRFNSNYSTLMRNTCSRITVESLDIGEHIYAFSDKLGTEHAIYLGYGGHVHWVALCRNHQVIQTSIQQFLNGRNLRIAQYGSSILDCFLNKENNTEESCDATTVIRRALAAMEERECNPWVAQDSLTFARYCKTGRVRAMSTNDNQDRRNNNWMSSRGKGTACGTMLGAGVGFVIAGPLGGLIGSLLGAGITYPSFTLLAGH